MDKLDAIIDKFGFTFDEDGTGEELICANRNNLKEFARSIAHQALVLASENAKVKDIAGGLFGGGDLQVDKQSILDVEKLIV
jgi:hypothetical protein